MSDRRAMKRQRPPVHPGDVEALRTSLPAHGILHTLAGDEEIVWQVPEEVPRHLRTIAVDDAVCKDTNRCTIKSTCLVCGNIIEFWLNARNRSGKNNVTWVNCWLHRARKNNASFHIAGC